MRGAKRGGFTLVEVLIVVALVGILASVALPRLTDAGADARQAALLHDLKLLRGFIQLYRAQHGGRFPAHGSTDGGLFARQLLLSSDADGTTGPAGTKPFGPYLLGAVPPNPFTGARGVRIVPDVPAAVPDDSPTDGWFYDPATGRIKANCRGKASDGVTDLAAF